jgi:hypothetical protein
MMTTALSPGRLWRFWSQSVSWMTVVSAGFDATVIRVHGLVAGDGCSLASYWLFAR